MKKIIYLLFISATLSATTRAQSITNTSKNGCGPIKETNKQKIMDNKIGKHGKNVLGTSLQIAGTSPMTGYYRDGYCSAGADDKGVHVIAAEVTEEFLQYSKSKGNDLITPYPAYGFQGLKAGDKWCLCAARWKEAYDANVAPPVILEATHEKALEFATLKEIKSVKRSSDKSQ